jgi:hypothetical protein
MSAIAFLALNVLWELLVWDLLTKRKIFFQKKCFQLLTQAQTVWYRFTMNIEQSLTGAFERTHERNLHAMRKHRGAVLHAIGMVQTLERKSGLPQTGVSHARRVVVALLACDCSYSEIVGYAESQGIAQSARRLVQIGVYQRGAYSERFGTPEVSYAGERIVEQTIEANGYRIMLPSVAPNETKQAYSVSELASGNSRAVAERDKVAERKG